MSNEALGLIERAAGLLGQGRMSQDEPYAGSRPPGHISEFDARVYTVPSGVVEHEDLCLDLFSS